MTSTPRTQKWRAKKKEERALRRAKLAQQPVDDSVNQSKSGYAVPPVRFEKFNRQKHIMLAVLATPMGSASVAAHAAGVVRSTIYDWRDDDPAFDKACRDAIENRVDMMEVEANRRATEGVLKPVFQQGECVGHIREYSDILLINQLKANRPQMYRDRVDMHATGVINLQVSETDKKL